MSGAQRIRILHISDLHARGARDQRRAWKRTQVLGDAWRRNLDELTADGQGFELVAFTGDVADWGLPEDYAEATSFVDELLTHLKIPRERFFAVPGNHDIQRKLRKSAWRKMREGMWSARQQVGEWLADAGKVPFGFQPKWRDAVLDREQAFWNWIERDLGRSDLLPKNSPHGRLGYRVSISVGMQPVHIIGLDSAWLAGDNSDAGKLWLTEDQLGRLCRDDRGQALPGFRLALVHHPLSDLADADIAQRHLADTVDLVLRGHQHTPLARTEYQPDRSFRELAAGCLYEGDQSNQYPNACQVIDAVFGSDGDPLQYEVRFRAWSAKGHWHDDGALYREATNGRLIWPTRQTGIAPLESARVQMPVREHPRPDFDEARYLKKCSDAFDPCWMPLELRAADLPATLYCASSANPLHRSSAANRELDASSNDAAQALASAAVGAVHIILGPGGAGKTTLLRAASARAAKCRREDPKAPLPILVPLEGYNGDLGAIINSILEIRHSVWDSLPGPFLILLDGLDRLPPPHLPALAQELDSLAYRNRTALILTCRTGGAQRDFRLPEGTVVLRLGRPSPRSIKHMARTVLGPRQGAEFLGALWGKPYIYQLLNLPYGLAVAMRCYREQQAIPLTDRELVNRVVEQRLVHDRRHHQSLAEPLADIPDEIVRRLAESVAFRLRVVRRSLYFSKGDAGALMREAIEELCSTQALGAERLDSMAALHLLEHYEFLVKSTNTGWVVVHDLVVDFLMAERLAATWRKHEPELRSRIFDDAWVFAASYISASERDEFLLAMLAVDVIRGARCAREIGCLGHIASEVLQYAEKARLPYERWQAATALAIIGTEQVSQFLHNLATGSEDDPWYHHAIRALASMGDEGIINTALADWDERRCGPIKVGHWWDDVVRISHPAVLLRVARRRLQQRVAEQCLSTTLDVVAMYGGEEDARSIIDAVRQTPSLEGLAEGIRALHSLAPVVAVNLARELLECPRQIHIVVAELLWRWNEPVAPERLIGIVLEPEVPDEFLAEYLRPPQLKGLDESVLSFSRDAQKEAASEKLLRDPEFQRSEYEHSWSAQCRRAMELLGRLPLDNGSQMRLREAYDGALPVVRRRIWNIAIDHAFPAFEDAADFQLNSGSSEEKSYAARYLMAFHADSARLRPYLSAVEAEIELIKASQAPERTWELNVMLHFYERASGPHAAA